MTRGVYLHDDVTDKVLPKDEVLAMRAKRRAEKSSRSGIFEFRTIERGVWVFDRRTGELVPKSQYRPQSGVTIRKDIDPYLAVTGRKVDGKLVRDYIGGRKQHLDNLKARNMEEVGNEKITKQYEAAPGVAEDIRRAMHEEGYHRSY